MYINMVPSLHVCKLVIAIKLSFLCVQIATWRKSYHLDDFSKTNPPYLAFNEFTHNLVVEVIDGGPFDALIHILLLLSFEGELNEDLLQFLIDKVDAELLKAIFLIVNNN